MSSDYTVGDTIYKLFTTRSFSTGAPAALGGTPVVSAYENDSATQITAGITLGVDHDGVTGLNLLTIAATGGNGFESGKDYAFVITTGTVGGVTVIGESVSSFSLGRSAAAVDLANGTDGLTALKADTAATLTDTAAMQPLVAKIPLSDGSITWNSTALASVNAECDTALTDYDAPTNTEMNARTIVSANYATSAAQTTAQNDLDIITGVSGVNLLTATQASIDAIESDTNELQTDWVDGGRLDTLLDAIPTTAMRGTDSAALASVCTEGRLAELDAANLPADLDAVLVDTGTTIPATLGTPAGADMSADIAAIPTAAEILTTQMTEAYAADGTAPTLAESLFIIQQFLHEHASAGTTKTVKKIDGSTVAATFTYDDGTNPTSLTRTT